MMGFMANPTLLVLAAGMGSRYGGLKQVDPMGPNGEAVLDYSVYDAGRAGFGRVVFVIREELREAFREQIEPRVPEGMAVDYACQRLEDLPGGHTVPAGRTKPWGTAHAVYAARDVIDGPFAVVNADDFYGRDAYRAMGAWLGAPPVADGLRHYAMVGYRLDRTLSDHGAVNRGICEVDGAGRLVEVEEFLEIARGGDGVIRGTGQDGTVSELSGDAVCSMNFWGFHATVFEEIGGILERFLTERGGEAKAECYIPNILDALIRAGRADCEVLPTTASWFGVTYPEDKPTVVASIRRLIDEGEYPMALR